MKQYLSLCVIITALIMSGCSRTKKAPLPVERGISIQLNNLRKEAISKPVYKLFFKIPPKKTMPIKGNLSLTFVLKNKDYPVILDFQNPKEFVHQVMAEWESQSLHL